MKAKTDPEKSHNAVEQRQLEDCRDTVIGRGYSVKSLHDPCADGNLQVVKYLVETVGANAEVTNQRGRTALHDAVAYGHLDVVKYLVENAGVDVYATDAMGNTPLDEARALVERGETKNPSDLSGVIEYLKALEQKHRDDNRILNDEIDQYLRYLDIHKKETARLTGSTRNSNSLDGNQLDVMRGSKRKHGTPAARKNTPALKKREKDLKDFEDRVVFIQGQVKLAQQGNRGAQRLFIDMDPIFALRVVWEEICSDHQLEDPQNTERGAPNVTNRVFLSSLSLQSGSCEDPKDNEGTCGQTPNPASEKGERR